MNGAKEWWGALSPQRHLLCQKCTSIISALCAGESRERDTEKKRERGARAREEQSETGREGQVHQYLGMEEGGGGG